MLRNSRLILGLLLLATARYGYSQVARQHSTDSRNAGDVYVGGSYAVRSYEHTQDNSISGGAGGWESSVGASLGSQRPWIGVRFDASGIYSGSAHAYFFAAGPEIKKHVGREIVFVHGLVGVAHLNGGVGNLFPLKSNAVLGVVAGGGVDTPIGRRLAWRVAGDYLYSDFVAGGVETNQLQLVTSNFRVSSGIVFRF